ncbi:MAG: N-6 DNA methylase [Pirellulaceae bacterium]
MIPESPDTRSSVESFRSVGAPLVFVCCHDGIQWWKLGRDSAEWLESIPEARLESFFREHQHQFSPDAIYRAKTLGRVRGEYQLNFVDIGMMPLLEEEVGTALSRLISRNVADLKQRVGWDDVNNEQGQWLLQTIFWLVSGKILRDKEVPGFEDIQLDDVEDVFERVARHYGTQPFKAGSKQKREALQESARTIDRFSSLSLTTTESLAYVYENTLISKQTRTQLGTHSTPSYLIDYVLGHLADWIEEIPENDRSVFEPACGHAGFLVAAMRLLTQLLPDDKAIPSRRGPYLRSRLHGTDIDPFALELARLSLTLTDIPNPDGWDLRVEDMFVGNRLAEQTKGNTILLANPPFANFGDDELSKYAKAGTNIVVKNKAAEMLRLTLAELTPGSVFGVVLPQTVLHGAFAKDVRRFLIENFELREISLFPDKVFPFSDAESAVIVGRRLNAGMKSHDKVRFRRIRERQMPKFITAYEASTSQRIEQKRFKQANKWDLRIPDLEEVWQYLANYPTANDLAELGTGLVYHGKDLPQGVPTFSDEHFDGAVQGYVSMERGLPLHELPTLYWMNLSEDATLRRRAGVVTGVPQVLMNYARVSRGPWRLKAFIDSVGRPVTSSFLTVRSRATPLAVVWALMSSAIANTYAFCHLGKRHNIVGDMRRVPMPKAHSFAGIEVAANAYIAAASAGSDSETLRSLMSKLDAQVLRQYDLPLDLEQSVLSLFTDWKRVGVPFNQTRFLPESLEGKLHYADFVDYEADWPKTNRRRGKLIDKDIAGTLSDAERMELEGLQAYADYHLERVAPRPTHVLKQLEDLVLATSTASKRGE